MANGSQSALLIFGGHQSWLQREQSFHLNSTTKVNINTSSTVIPENDFNDEKVFFSPSLLNIKCICNYRVLTSALQVHRAFVHNDGGRNGSRRHQICQEV